MKVLGKKIKNVLLTSLLLASNNLYACGGGIQVQKVFFVKTLAMLFITFKKFPAQTQLLIDAIEGSSDMLKSVLITLLESKFTKLHFIRSTSAESLSST